MLDREKGTTYSIMFIITNIQDKKIKKERNNERNNEKYIISPVYLFSYFQDNGCQVA